MKVLVTGHHGYIGSVFTPILLQKGYSVRGLDIGYFAECLLHPIKEDFEQVQRDIRDVTLENVEGVDAIVHLAALSNDPLGELAPGLTEEINLGGTLRLAKLAKEAGVSRFVYSSSQSMYGISRTDDELDEDNSEKNAITTYARTKWEAECALKAMNDDDFTVVCFRPSTVFGASPRLRCDIVFNNLVACAYTTGKIEIKSDGTPWRPVVHVKDVCAAYLAGLEAPERLVGGRSFNVGIPDGNFMVRELAEAAQRAVPGCELTFTGEHGNDTRTYRISFSRILTELKGYYQPEWNLSRGGQELVELFRQAKFTEKMFRGTVCNRIQQIKLLLDQQSLNQQLGWT